MILCLLISWWCLFVCICLVVSCENAYYVPCRAITQGCLYYIVTYSIITDYYLSMRVCSSVTSSVLCMSRAVTVTMSRSIIDRLLSILYPRYSPLLNYLQTWSMRSMLRVIIVTTICRMIYLLSTLFASLLLANVVRAIVTWRDKRLLPSSSSCCCCRCRHAYHAYYHGMHAPFPVYMCSARKWRVGVQLPLSTRPLCSRPHHVLLLFYMKAADDDVNRPRSRCVPSTRSRIIMAPCVVCWSFIYLLWKMNTSLYLDVDRLR
jgi:hypothetical protein